MKNKKFIFNRHKKYVEIFIYLFNKNRHYEKLLISNLVQNENIKIEMAKIRNHINLRIHEK